MQAIVVLTVIGENKPGMLGKLSEAVAENDGSWLESRMAHLGRKFAGIVQVALPEGKLPALERRLDQLDLQIKVERADGDEPHAAAVRALSLEVVGHDRPGIVRQVAHALALREVDVEELTTRCESAPMSGEAMFRAVAQLRVPAEFDVETLRQNLEQIGTDLVVDIVLAESSPQH